MGLRGRGNGWRCRLVVGDGGVNVGLLGRIMVENLGESCQGVSELVVMGLVVALEDGVEHAVLAFVGLCQQGQDLEVLLLLYAEFGGELGICGSEVVETHD